MVRPGIYICTYLATTSSGCRSAADLVPIFLERGYANVVPDPGSVDDVVYGLVYTLTSSDETALDRNEGVPHVYSKEMMSVDFWPSQQGGEVDVRDTSRGIEVLVYIDRRRVGGDVPKEEYVHRMNMGICDALAAGVPQGYVDTVMRSFIPLEGKVGVKEVARRQALAFRDET